MYKIRPNQFLLKALRWLAMEDGHIPPQHPSSIHVNSNKNDSLKYVRWYAKLNAINKSFISYASLTQIVDLASAERLLLVYISSLT